jgi:hypothetical protein
MTPNDTPSEATVPGSPPAVDAVTPLSLPVTCDRSYSAIKSQAAISGGIDQSTSHGRHQHPDPGSLER